MQNKFLADSNNFKRWFYSTFRNNWLTLQTKKTKGMSETYNYMEEEQGGLMACESSSWGGQWTEEKLEAFEKYVNAYLHYHEFF